MNVSLSETFDVYIRSSSIANVTRTSTTESGTIKFTRHESEVLSAIKAGRVSGDVMGQRDIGI